MPSNFQNVLPSTSIGPSGSFIFDIDVYTFNNQPFNLLISQYYASTSNPTGLSLTIYDGAGVGNSLAQGGLPSVVGGANNVIYNTTGVAYTLNALTPNSSNQTSITSGQFLTYKTSRWIRLAFVNQDTTYQGILKILGVI